MSYSIFDIARWLILHYNITDKQILQKLCYYVQAWYLVFERKALFPEVFAGGVYGPVNWELFDTPLTKRPPNTSPLLNTKPVAPSDETILRIVMQIYGKFSSSELIAMSCSEEPWIKSREGLAPLAARCKDIPLADMYDYYSKELFSNEKYVSLYRFYKQYHYKVTGFKIYVSQKLYNKTNEEVDQEFSDVTAKLDKIYSNSIFISCKSRSPVTVDIVDVYKGHKLINALSVLADCDLIFFCDDWGTDKDCIMEHAYALYYGITPIYTSDLRMFERSAQYFEKR